MKYQVGDKVKYDSGDWWFYGTVTAVIENAICPCYRLNVDRMVKKNCKFSITQFEFELEADHEIESEKDKTKWENAEIEYFKKYNRVRHKVDISQEIKPVSDVITPEPEPLPIPDPEPVQSTEPAPAPNQKPRQKPGRKPAKKQQLQPEQKQEAIEIEAPLIQIEQSKPKRADAWKKNLELYKAGMKGSFIYAWVAQNRRLYNSNNLSEDKLQKLIEINFPFEIKKSQSKQPNPDTRNVNNIWEKQYNLWKQGERRSLEQWRQKSVKQYVKGKLSKEKIEKLRAVGILK